MTQELIQEALLTLTAEVKEIKWRLRNLEGKGLPTMDELEDWGLKPSYVPGQVKVTFEGDE